MGSLPALNGETLSENFDCGLQSYCGSVRLRQKGFGGDIARLSPLTTKTRTLALGGGAFHICEGETMGTNHLQSMQAEDICKSLEFAILKYFPRPIEDVDALLFALANDMKPHAHSGN